MKWVYPNSKTQDDICKNPKNMKITKPESDKSQNSNYLKLKKITF